MTRPAPTDLPDPPLDADDRRTARYFMALTLLATVMFALALVLGFQLAGAPAQDTRGCTPDTEERDCGPDEACVRGRCKPLPPILEVLPCQEGDPCDGGCVCEGAFTCGEDRVCRAPREDACSEAVAGLLADLRRFERSQCKKFEGADASQCPPRALDQFFISHQQFDAILLGLRHTTTVHFDSRRAGADLPESQQRSYQSQFMPLAERLRQARSILVIARASQDARDDLRAQSNNYIIAQNRLDAVARWVVGIESSPSDQDAMARKLIRLAIGTSHPLRAEVLARNPEHHYITWSRRQDERLRAGVQHHQDLDPRAASDLLRALNQSVLLVPIPCVLPDPAH